MTTYSGSGAGRGAAQGFRTTRRDVLQGLAAGAGGLALGSLTGTAAAQSAPDYIINYWGSEKEPQVTTLEEFVPKLIERSKGVLNIKSFPGGTLYGDKDIADVLPAGNLDYSFVTLGQLSGLAPTVALFGLPLFNDEAHLYRAIDGGIGDIINEELAASNIKVAEWFTLGPPLISNSMRPLTKPADFAGLTLRVYSEDTAAWVKAVGGAPTFIPYPEQYLALQRGTVQGSVGGLTGMVGQHLWEVQKYVLYPEGLFGFVQMGFVINTVRFAKLPQEGQQILTGWFAEHEAAIRKRSNEQYWGTGEFEGKGEIEQLTSNGMELTRPENPDELWWPVLSDLRDAFIEKLGDKGARIMDVVNKTKA